MRTSGSRHDLDGVVRLLHRAGLRRVAERLSLATAQSAPPAKTSGKATGKASAQAAPHGPININTASAADFDALLAAADRRMYHDKTMARRCAAHWTELAESAREAARTILRD